MINIKKSKTARPVMIALFGCFIIACNSDKKAEEKTLALEEYNVLELGQRSVTVFEDYPATLEGEEVTEIRSKVEGYLENLYVDEGARVKRGQLLFKVNNPQYEQELRIAEAGVHTAEANVLSAEMTVNKTKPLVESEIISEYELQSAQYALRSYKAALAQARAVLVNAKANVNFTFITSPADGIIGEIPYKKGSLISSTLTNPLTRLSSDGNVYAYFSLNEKQLLDFNKRFAGKDIQQKLAQLPEISLILSDGTIYPYEGKVQIASGLITTETGTAIFRATFKNPDVLLSSGASGLVRIPKPIPDALMIPQNATYEVQDKRMVYVLVGGNKVMSKAITTIPTNDANFFIVTSGLSKGDKIILNGLNSLDDDIVIRPKLVDPNLVYNNKDN